MVVPPALSTTVLPPPEVWDDDADFDFGGEENDPSSTAFSTLRRPASFTSDVDIFEGEPALDSHSGSSGNGDHHPHHRGPASASGSASSRTSRSGMSSSAHTYRSTDLTDPEGSPANSFHGGDIHKRKSADSSAGLSPQRAYDTVRPLSTSPTALDSPFANLRRSKLTGAEANRGSPSGVASGSAQRWRQNSHEIASNSSEHELDFELGEEVSQLHLAPNTLRKRPSSSLEQDRLTLWDSETPATGVSEADAQNSQSKAGGAMGCTRSSPSPNRHSGPDSDNDGALGDDESEAAEPIEEGLDLPDSIFGSSTAAAGGAAPSTLERPSAKLRAILSARLRGQHLSSIQPTSTPTKSTSELLAGGVLDFDADTDVVTGLVITDDLDLSPSRLAAKSLSFKTRKGLGFGTGGAGSNTVPRSQLEQSRAGSGKGERLRPSGTNVRTWNSGSNTSHTTQLPTVVLTNSSPAQPERTQSSSSQRSPPRALSSFSHAPGAGPRMYAFPSAISPSVRSSGNADPFRPTSPSGSSHQQQHGVSAARKSPTLLSPDGFSGPSFLGVENPPASSQHHQRRQSLVRKQSMPVLLSDQASGNKHASTSAALSAVHASITANASALSRLMASTASSRAREAETAARMAARASTAAGEVDADRNSPTSRLPPSRPSTPVNGAVRYTLSTATSRIRRIGGGGAEGSNSRPGSSSGTQGRSTPNMYSAITASAAAAKDAARVMRRPTRARNYGTGNELDGFDDLPTSQEAESRFRRTPLRQASNASSMTMSSIVGDETLKVRPRDLPQLFTPVKDPASTLTSRNISQIYGSQNAIAGPSSSSQRTSSRAGSQASSGTVGAAPSSVRQRLSRNSSAATSNSQPPRSRRPTLIRNMGGNSNNRSRVVGDMRWNPALQRWEGNESALRAFDNVINSSSRPALISPLTTSSVNSLMSSSSSLFTLGGKSHSTLLGSRKSVTTLTGAVHQSRSSAASSPVAGRGSFSVASAAPAAPTSIPASNSNSTSFGDSHGNLQGTRVVGDMIFDPQRLCWLSMAGTEEPDVFADMGEDDDDDDFLGGGADDKPKAAEGGRSQLLFTAGDAVLANRDGAESGILSSSSRQRGSSTIESIAGGGWSSGWGVGVRSGAGRSSNGSTMDDDDEEEMSKSVGYPGSNLNQQKDASGGLVVPLTGAASSSVQKQQQQASSYQSQQQNHSARRIRSADLLRTIPATGSSMDYASVYLAQGPTSGAKKSTPAATSTDAAVSTGSVTDYDDEELERLCREAESRHRVEMRGFLPKGATDPTANVGIRAEIDPRSHLYLLQRLAREASR